MHQAPHATTKLAGAFLAATRGKPESGTIHLIREAKRDHDHRLRARRTHEREQREAERLARNAAQAERARLTQNLNVLFEPEGRA